MFAQAIFMSWLKCLCLKADVGKDNTIQLTRVKQGEGWCLQVLF